MQKQVESERAYSKLKFDKKKQIRPRLDLSSLTAQTLGTLMNYLEIEQGDFDRNLNRKLT